ncbi:multicopper ferroxidase [Raphidocelis subcapitata]|uniref:Multicopper ferroxidase n=1 Tax=Raphidocelis subcapitata TaxID=307507 RepID=A0A2V0PQ67_9CHLO|nr:multicopper ferroxidase [Raphidocelis subcapitata]|eukprot:GBF99637.1 multicopper ferroxidase [Raphidocelis subcapitata]
MAPPMIKVVSDEPVKALPAAPPPHRPRWLLPAAAAGLVTLGAAIALAVALPITLRPMAARRFEPLDVGAGDAAAAAPGVDRTYYLAADDVEWDYAPSGSNMCKGTPFGEHEALYVSTGKGTKYTKALFHEYTDATFQTQKRRTPEQQHMGLLGPALYAEVGDTITVVLRNNAPFPVNAEPGGVAASPAALVNPGGTLTYRWKVPASAGPSEDGPSTRLWLYRSTANIVGDTQAGLAGPIVVARRGGLGENGRPSDVDREFFLTLQVFNENNSPFYEENMAAADPAALAGLSEDDLMESNTKYTVNGFLWCNLPGLNMTVGDRVRWYVTSLGSEDAIHNAHWHGVVFNDSRGHHVDQVTVQSSSLEALDMVADNPGTWLFHCHLNDHMDGGMMARFHIDGAAPKVELGGKTRNYYIAAVLEEWDYAPFGGEMCGATLVPFSDNAKTFLEPGPDRVGRKYMKARYVEFTDATFTRKKRIAPEWEHLGVLGPVLRGVVGDTLLVTFANKLPEGYPSVSMHPHGVLYDKGSEGSPYSDGMPPAPSDAVAPGQTVTYTWQVPERSGPGAGDFSSVMWMYHSHVMESRDPHAGLFGAILITRADLANEDATPKDVDREFVLSFSILDESHSFLLDANVKKYLPKVAANDTALAALLEDPGFLEANLKHSINGYLYCNLPGFEFSQARPSRLYFMALGGSGDMHTPNSAEGGLYLDGQRRQSVRLLPGTMLTTDISPMVPGHGMLQCHIYDHISAGMSALYKVNATVKLDSPADAPVRRHYIAAELLDWDYVPLGLDGCTGQPFNEDQEVFVKTTNETMGSRYTKAVYRAYTDATFTKRAPREAALGILGPTLRAEVGDKIVVHFLNRLPFNASVQLFGGLVPLGNTTAYQVNVADAAAEAEAASAAAAAPAAAPAGRRLLSGRRGLSQITAAQAEAEAVIAQSVSNIYSLGAVRPGAPAKYEWLVPDAAGPGPVDGDVVAYAYVSGVDHIKHINAGLVGALLVYAKGAMPAADGGGLRELPLLFNIQNEMQSELYQRSVDLERNRTRINMQTTALTWPESNLMHSINGYLYCNGPTLQMQPGEKLRLIIMGFGSEVDMHSPVFAGQTLSHQGTSTYSVGVMPATTFVVDLEAGAPGTWDYYCNILDHINAGMKGRMVVG